jgi:hypothetical protein
MSPPERRKYRWGKWALVAASLLAVSWLLGSWFLAPPYRPLAAPFNGRSEELARTVVVPTLDTALPAGKSAIWCSSFQVAWNRLRSESVISRAIFEAKSEAGREFYFDHPFLVLMKKWGSRRPFFVLWVDNAELLLRPGALPEER